MSQRFHIILDRVNQTADKRAKVWPDHERDRKCQKCGKQEQKDRPKAAFCPSTWVIVRSRGV